jgi:hypothetical protein
LTGLAAVDEAKALDAHWARQLAIILIPGKTERTPSRRAAVHVLAAFDAASA